MGKKNFVLMVSVAVSVAVLFCTGCGKPKAKPTSSNKASSQSGSGNDGGLSGINFSDLKKQFDSVMETIKNLLPDLIKQIGDLGTLDPAAITKLITDRISQAANNVDGLIDEIQKEIDGMDMSKPGAAELKAKLTNLLNQLKASKGTIQAVAAQLLNLFT